MDNWPRRFVGEIYSAHDSPNQWEIGHFGSKIYDELPIHESYKETWVQGVLKSPGTEIKCWFEETTSTVDAQFHRRQVKDKRRLMWIGPNSFNGLSVNRSATDRWYVFLSSFGIKKGYFVSPIPIEVEFFPDKAVIWRIGANR